MKENEVKEPGKYNYFYPGYTHYESVILRMAFYKNDEAAVADMCRCHESGLIKCYACQMQELREKYKEKSDLWFKKTTRKKTLEDSYFKLSVHRAMGMKKYL